MSGRGGPEQQERGASSPSGSGSTRASRESLVWPYQTLPTVDPEALDAFDPRDYLYERYPRRGRSSPALKLYYALRPVVPRRLQLALRRAYLPVQRLATFPAWPIEPLLVEAQYAHLRDRLMRSEAGRLPFVNFWPNGRRFAFVLTHDVESEAGIEAIPRLLEVEQRHGFTSSWNFCAEQYPIPGGLFDDLRAAGCEVGLHGILHDGKLFSSRKHFESCLPKIHRYLNEWQVDGFRSPATHRKAEWMPELACRYDSSFPDTDPFEPVAGGCCSIFPFFIDGMVELPITLAQDHTLFEILRGRSISPWTVKSEWIIRHHGLINLIVHPDYMRSADRLALYERFLIFLKQQQGGWHALPHEVAQWWSSRSLLDLEAVARSEGGWDPSALHPTIAHVLDDSGRLTFDLARPRRGARFSAGQDGDPARPGRTSGTAHGPA